MPSITVHGLRIAYHRFPAATPAELSPVACLPSTGLSGLQWRRLAKLLSRRGHDVLCVDLIGYGESEDWPRPGPFRTEYDVDVVDALLDLCERPVHLVAHSYGGRVGLRAGLRRPQLLRSLSLYEPTCFGLLRSTGDTLGLAELGDYDADGRFLDDAFGGSEAWVERFIDYWSGPGSFAELDEDERRAWMRSSRKMFEEVRETALDDVPHTRYVDALGQLSTLVISGATSTRAGQRCCDVFAQVMPRCRHVELADVGHMGPVLAPREVAELIAGHIADVEASDT
ncbi:Hydrolase, alpha/beta fold family protein [Enhygromyxa salina]|uniref:Hydrolase, alpha/beta fold family protein n=1 Tax=Enhygromyxa salina TaxID=215803 RepID=A0A0C2CZ12_9BACT|nr:alpha/beta hydrolase [Enhygromyxa salina]KIG14875.1 Hydrolase, alpha/beta fold family protein [Enhygromyxa salina]